MNIEELAAVLGDGLEGRDVQAVAILVRYRSGEVEQFGAHADVPADVVAWADEVPLMVEDWLEVPDALKTA